MNENTRQSAEMVWSITMLGFNARRAGFTLMDTMIVVLILAILAAIVAPKFTDAVEDSRDAALCTDLHLLRQQTLLYITQHGGRGPHLKPDWSQDTSANFILRMTGRTDPDGTINDKGACGPYFRSWPTNSYRPGKNTGTICFGASPSSPRDNKDGWYFSTSTCMISADSKTGGKSMDP